MCFFWEWQDYEGFDDANENDCLEEFLKLPRGSLPQVPVINHSLSNFSSRDVSCRCTSSWDQPTTNGLLFQVSLEKEVVVVANGSEELNKVDLPDASENGQYNTVVVVLHPSFLVVVVYLVVYLL